MTQEDIIEKIAKDVAQAMDGRTVANHKHYREMLAKELKLRLEKYNISE